MISFSCPGCQATFKLPDEMAGKTARCSKCNQRFTVPGGKSKPAPAPAPAPPAMSPPPMAPKKAPLNPLPKVLEAEVLEAEVIDEPAPPPRRPAQRAAAVDEVDVVDEVQVVDEAAIQEPPRRGRRPAAYDDEDDDDRRRPGRRDRDDRDRDHWEDDDDADRPRRKRRRPGSGSSKMGVIMASIGGGAFVMMIISLVGMTLSAQPVVRNQPFNMNQQPPIQFNPPPNFQPQQNRPAPAPANAVMILDKQDQLTMNDEFDTMFKASRSKRYNVQLQAGKTYTIEMIRTGNQKQPGLRMDPYLRLELNAQTVAQDDDSAGSLNARIVFRAQQTAQHVLIATSLNPATGDYRLTVRESP